MSLPAPPCPTKPGVDVVAAWEWICARAAEGAVGPLPAPLSAAAERLITLFSPLLVLGPDRPLVFAHLAQSLDGRIALPEGEAFWISGPEDIRHTHRLRAVADAVIVGAETVARDDPRLTVRECTGPHPLRVVLDPSGRLGTHHRVFDGEAPVLAVRAVDRAHGGDVPELLLPELSFRPADIVSHLAARGVRRIYIEGGGVTVSRFLAAGMLDRLHLVTAPVLLGQGRPSLQAPLAEALADCPRPPTRMFPLGRDWLFDLALTGVGQV